MRKCIQKFAFRRLALILGVVGMMGMNHASGESGPPLQGTVKDSSNAERALPLHQMYGFARNGDWEAIRTLFRSLNGETDKPEGDKKNNLFGEELGKLRFALDVIQLGAKDKDEEYFLYLAERAQVAIERDVPFPLKFDENGKVVRGEMSEAFVAWCDKHEIDPGKRASGIIYEDPMPVMMLAESGDLRASPLLLRGLTSPNFYIRGWAAHGLGLIGDARSITPIVDAIEQVPEEVKELIGRELGYFNHPKAQAALARFIQDPQKRQRYIASARAVLDKRKNRAKKF